MRHPRAPDWPGYIAFILSMGLSIGFATALIMSASSRTPPIGKETSTLLATIGGSMVGAVATYLGGRMGRDRSENQQRPPDGDDQP